MATRATLENRRSLAAGVKEEQRRLRTAALEGLRAQILHVHNRRKALTERVRAQCRRARARVREQIKARRVEVRETLNREVAELRQAERNRCQLRQARVKIESESARARAERERRERKLAEAAARRIERHRERKLAAYKRAEARGESDDEVRANVDQELVPVFDVVRAKVRPRPGMSRTEAFLHWVEENPSEVWQMRSELAEKRLRALIREEEQARKSLRAVGGRAKRQSTRARRAALPEAPF
jgi:hypothetical protein